MRDEGRLDLVQSALVPRQRSHPRSRYDTEADPHEVRDLVGDPAYRPHLERLRAALDGWLLETGDRPGRPERELVESMWPGGVQPRTAAPAIAWHDGRVAIECPTAGSAIAYQVDGRGLPPEPLASLHGAVRGAERSRDHGVRQPCRLRAKPRGALRRALRGGRGGSQSRGQRQLVEPTQVLSRLNLTPIILPRESRASVVTGTGRPSRQTNMTRTSTRERPPSAASTTGA